MMRLSKLLVPLLALLVLVAIVVGIPIALLVFVGMPVPDPLPTMTELGDMAAGRQSIPADLLISVFAIAIWLLWAQLAWVVFVEAAAAFQGRLARRARVFPGLQLLIGKLVTAATLLTSVLSVRPVVAAPLLPPAVATPSEEGGTEGESNDESEQASQAAGQSTSSGPGPVVRPYMTEVGDTWWGIAEQTFGSGTRWKEIRNLNLGRTMDDGTVISVGTDLLRPEWRLLLPSATGPGNAAGTVEVDHPDGSVADPAGDQVREVVVEPGDTLWELAEEELVDHRQENGAEPGVVAVAERVDEIVEVNRADLGGNPDLIFPGQRLDFPPLPGLPRPGPPPAEPDPEIEAEFEPAAEAEPGPSSTIAPPVEPTIDDRSVEEPTVEESAVEEQAPDERSSGQIDPAPPATSERVELPLGDSKIIREMPKGAPDQPASPAGSTSSASPDGSASSDSSASSDRSDSSARSDRPDGPDRPDGSDRPDNSDGAGLDSESTDERSAPPASSPPPAPADPSADQPTSDSGAIATPVRPTPPLAGAEADVGGPTPDGRPAGEARAQSEPSLETAGPIVEPAAPAEGAEPSGPGLDTDDSDSELAQSGENGSPDGEALDTSESRAPVYAGLAALTLVGGYLHRARGRRRKTALQNRHPGTRPKPAKGRTRSLARRLASMAEPEHPEFVNNGLRALARLLQDQRPEELPRISGVWVSQNRLVLALAADSPKQSPPAPFTPFADGSGWSLLRSHFNEIRTIARGANGPLPLLTTVGTTTSLDLALTTNSRAPAEAYGLASSLLFAVDLEVGRVVSVQSAHRPDVIETLTMMALELATSETADQAEIVCVGFGSRLETFDRVMVVDRLAQVIDDLESVTSRAVYAASDATPFATRVRNGAADTWDPVIVFHANPDDPDVSTLVELAERTEGGVTAVCGYPTSTGWSFMVDGDEIYCPELPGSLANHRFMRPQPADIELITELFDESWEDIELDDDFWAPIDELRPSEANESASGLAGQSARSGLSDSWRPMAPIGASSSSGSESTGSERELPTLRHSVEHQAQTTGSAEAPPPESRLGSNGNGVPPVEPVDDAVEPSPGRHLYVVGGSGTGPSPDDGADQTGEGDHSPEAEPAESDQSESSRSALPGWDVRQRSSIEAEEPEADLSAQLDPVEADAVVPQSEAVIVEESPASASGPGRIHRRRLGAGPAASEPTIQVSILGNFTIGEFHVGDRNKPWKYTKTAELILYLLLHPAGASQDLLMEQLFPDQPTNRPRLNQLVSDARTKALGVDANNEYHLPHASPTDPFYQLGPTVGFDLRDFARHCAAARRADQPEAEAGAWQAALELVGGRPFSLPHDGYGWALPEIEATIVKVEEAAVALADIAMELGDHRLAVWATKKGLLTGTGYYELLVRRGRAALLLQDPEEIVRAFADLQVSLEFTGAPEEGTPDLSGHPALAEIYNELSGGRGRDRKP